MYRKFIKRLNQFNSVFIELEKWISFVIYAFLIFCLTAQVFMRFVLRAPAAWTEEWARYSFVVVMYIGCGFTLHYGKHVDMNLLDTFLNKAKNPKRAFFLMQKITMATNMLFCGIFASMYWPFLMKIKSNGKTAVTANVPMWLIMLSVLVGIVLMFWHSLVLFLQPYEEETGETREPEEGRKEQ